MRSLRDLLTTWETWSARETLTQALRRVDTNEAREVLRRGLTETPEADPLDALRDAAELVALLSDWRWQAVYAARVTGASWDEIGCAVRLDALQARNEFVRALDVLERDALLDTRNYRAVA